MMHQQQYDDARSAFMQAPNDRERQEALFKMLEATDRRLSNVERALDRLSPSD